MKYKCRILFPSNTLSTNCATGFRRTLDKRITNPPVTLRATTTANNHSTT